MSITGILATDLEAILVKNTANTGSGDVVIKNLLANAGAYGGDVATLPNGWSTDVETGATIDVVGYGNSPVFDGARYVDLQIVNNHASATRDVTLKFMPDTPRIAADLGDDFAFSAALQVISGTFAGNARFMMNEFVSSYAGTVFSSDLTIDSTMTRRSAVLTTVETGVTGITAWLRIVDVPVAADFTIRVTTPQVEKAAAVTSYQNTGTYEEI